MSKLFRNDSPGAKTLEQAREDEIKRQRELRRQAAELAAQGRGEDTEIAHVARGEMVIPEVLQTPEFMAALRHAADAEGISIAQLRVGSRCNSINPNTGVSEFDPYVVPGPPGEGIDVLAKPLTTPFPLTDSQRSLLDRLNGSAVRVGKQYGFNPDNLLGLAGHESAWFTDPESVQNNNPFGVNNPGTSQMRKFDSVDSAFDYWGKVFGRQLGGMDKTDHFVKGLRNLEVGPYNSKDEDYDQKVRNAIDSIKIKKPGWSGPQN